MLNTEKYKLAESQPILSGEESFLLNGTPLPFTIKDFWAWAYSDLISNISRGVLAEYIVQSALSLKSNDENSAARIVRYPYDLEGPNHLHIEVKSAAYVQSWDIFDRPPKSGRKINFRIAPATLPDENGDYNEKCEIKRASDVYVFCLYTATDFKQNILDMNLWKFYILATADLDQKLPNQKTISLSGLQALSPLEVNYDGIYEGILETYGKIGNIYF